MSKIHPTRKARTCRAGVDIATLAADVSPHPALWGHIVIAGLARLPKPWCRRLGVNGTRLIHALPKKDVDARHKAGHDEQKRF